MKGFATHEGTGLRLQLEKRMKSFIIVQLIIQSILAVEQQRPLLFPILGSPTSMKVRTWFYHNTSPADIRRGFATLDIVCHENEIEEATVYSGLKTMVFGDWEYRNSVPSSSITLSYNEEPVDNYWAEPYMFCIRPIDYGKTFLSMLLEPFDKKMLSFWWETSIDTYQTEQYTQVIGELAIGGMNSDRVNPMSNTISVRVNRATRAMIPHHYWSPINRLDISVGDDIRKWDKTVKLSVTVNSWIPTDLFDAITKPLRADMKYTVGLLKGMPQDTNKMIMSYLDLDKPIDVFDCKDASKLLPLRVGPITITPQMMYKKISDEKCKMALRKNVFTSFEAQLELGVDILKNFVVSIDFDRTGKDVMMFSERASQMPSLQSQISDVSSSRQRASRPRASPK